MKSEFLKTLWLLRFEKIKKIEEDAAWKYQEVMDHCIEEFGGDDQSVKILQKLVHEERMHSQLADELIRICRQNHPEDSIF